MTDLHEAILSILLSLPVHIADIGEVGRFERFDNLAQGMSQACERAACWGPYAGDWCRVVYGDRVSMAGMMIELGYEETGFSRHVQVGNCGPYECDPYWVAGRLRHRSHGPWSAHRNGMPLERWNSFLGVELNNVERAAWYSVTMLAGGFGSCGNMPGAFARYARGFGCSWSEADFRSVVALRFADRIRKAIQ